MCLETYMDNRRIGIIVPSGNLFNTGMAQNAFFIYEVLTKCGFMCDQLCFDENHKKLDYNSVPVKTIYDNDPRFDVKEYKLIITVATGICKAMYKICKENNIKVVAFICGNMLQANNACFISETSTATIVTRDRPCDEAWIIGSFAYMKTYVELMRNVPVKIVPHLWSPRLIEYDTQYNYKRDPANLTYNPANHKEMKATIIIMEPNVEYTKTSLIPIMAAEKFNQLYPDLLDEVFVFSFPVNSKAANTIVDSLSIKSKVRKFSRLRVADIFTSFNSKQSMPIFISHKQNHQWNYTYYELMYYGYPFIHNSDMLKWFGYYYDGFNIDACVEQIQIALEKHNYLNDIHMKKGRHYVDGIDPEKPISMKVWKELVDNMR